MRRDMDWLKQLRRQAENWAATRLIRAWWLELEADDLDEATAPRTTFYSERLRLKGAWMKLAVAVVGLPPALEQGAGDAPWPVPDWFRNEVAEVRRR